MADPSSHATTEAVAIWHASTESVCRDPRLVAHSLSWLLPAERERHARYRHDRDRDMFLVGRMMARSLVGRALGVAPTAWRWREGPKGRPEIADDGHAVSFNVAHSAGVVVCAVAHGRDVGVDVENRERPPVDRALVRRYCSPAEVADVEASGDRWRDRFLTYWTLKEAYLKARGLGIAVHLADVSFALGPRGVSIEFLNALSSASTAWAFHTSDLSPHHVMAAAAPVTASGPPQFIVRAFTADALG